MILWILQHQPKAEAVVPDVLRVHGDLVEDIPELRFVDVFHDHDPMGETARRFSIYLRL